MTALLALALAASAGEIDVDDLDHWRGQTDAMLHGPDGCWAFAGGGRVTLALYTPAGAFTRAGEKKYASTGTFSGFLREGRWTQLEYVETDDNGDPVAEGAKSGGPIDMDFDPRPLFGERKRKKRGGGNEGAAAAAGSAVDTANFVDRVLDSIDPSITTSYAQYNQDAERVEFVQHVPISEKAQSKEVTLRTLFPEGEHATAIDMLFPRRLNLNALVDDDDDKPPFKIVLMDAQAHLRSQTFDDGTVLPAAETVSAVVGALGFTVGWEQRLVYTTARPCTAEEAAYTPEEDEDKAPDEGDSADDGVPAEEAPSMEEAPPAEASDPVDEPASDDE